MWFDQTGRSLGVRLKGMNKWDSIFLAIMETHIAKKPCMGWLDHSKYGHVCYIDPDGFNNFANMSTAKYRRIRDKLSPEVIDMLIQYQNEFVNAV